MTDLVLNSSANETAVADFATEYRHNLLKNMLAGVVTTETNIGSPAFRRGPSSDAEGRGIAKCLQVAEVVLWRADLYRAAREQAQLGVFTGMPVPSDLLPPSPQLWVLFGNTQISLPDMRAVLCSVLLMPRAKELQALCFAHPMHSGTVFMSDDPHILNGGLLTVGRETEIESAELFACLSFMNSTVASSELLSLPRSARRRLGRGGQVRPMQIVRLRRKERGPNDDPHLSEREYQCQWIVRAHARRPNARMKEQRPVWVSSYIKGPQDKPLKPPTPTVTVVSR